MATNWDAILSNTNNLQDVLSILKKVLASLDIKADITTIDEALTLINSLDADVQEKLSDVTAAITKFNNTGGFISAPTLEALQAITPEYNYQVARVDDTGDEYRWNIDAIPAALWEPTGRNFISDSSTNLFIDTTLTIDLINNTVSGGGGIVVYGTLYIDGIPENQNISYIVGEFPFGLFKICINKKTKQFKVFNPIQKVDYDYVILGYIYGKQWYSIASGKKPTVISNTDSGVNLSYSEYVENAEIVLGEITLNRSEKTISSNSLIVWSSKIRIAVTDTLITYDSELIAIAVDINTKQLVAITPDFLLSPSHLVIAKVVGNVIFTESINGFFKQNGDYRFLIRGKVSEEKTNVSENAYVSPELRATIDFSTGEIRVTQAGFIFAKGTYHGIVPQVILFDINNPVYLRCLTYCFNPTEIQFKQSRTEQRGGDEVVIGYVYNYQFYGLDNAKSQFTIINSSGQVVDQGAESDSFDELNQRALIPNKLFFIENRALPLYKDSVFSNPKMGLEKVRTWIDTNNTETLKRYISVQQQTILNPQDLTNTAQFVYAHESVANKRYWKNVAVYKAAQSKLSRSFNMLCFGDSLTQVGTPWTLKNKLESLGANVTPVGTFWSTETPNELPSEGRGYWNYREFIGKDNNSAGTPHTRSEGGKTRTAKFENPFLKLATTQDKTDHPTWCFRFTGSQKELSYADDPNKSGNFYIFDFDWYQTQHSVANPDFITIGLSTNDINLDRSIYSRSEVMQYMQLGLEIMVKQIHKVLPNVPIGIIPCPAWSATENGYTTFAADTANWVELCIKKVAELKTIHSNLEVIPVHLHMNRDMGYPLTVGSMLTVDSDISVSTVSDWVHYDQIGRDQYAEVVAAWLTNSI